MTQQEARVVRLARVDGSIIVRERPLRLTQRGSGRYPVWSASTPDAVIIDEIVRLSGTGGTIGWTWGEAEQDVELPDVEVAFHIDLSNLRSMTVGVLVVPDRMPVAERWEASSTSWSRRADRILRCAREQLADHPTIGLVNSFADNTGVASLKITR